MVTVLTSIQYHFLKGREDVLLCHRRKKQSRLARLVGRSQQTGSYLTSVGMCYT